MIYEIVIIRLNVKSSTSLYDSAKLQDTQLNGRMMV